MGYAQRVQEFSGAFVRQTSGNYLALDSTRWRYTHTGTSWYGSNESKKIFNANVLQTALFYLCV